MTVQEDESAINDLRQQLQVLGVDIAEARRHPSHRLQQAVAALATALDTHDVSAAGLLASITSHVLLQHQLEDVNVRQWSTTCLHTAASNTVPQHHQRRRSVSTPPTLIPSARSCKHLYRSCRSR